MAAARSQHIQLRRLTKRAQFLRVARGQRANATGMQLQAIKSDDALPGLGFTVTKKSGNAPQRNRIKRRLREAVRACATQFRPQHDYVLIGRPEALTESFSGLVTGLGSLIARVHDTSRPAPHHKGRKPAKAKENHARLP